MKTTTAISRCLITCLGAVLLTLSFSSCRTTQGLGQDIKHVGSKIENEAAKH
jgi:predicted small secreted protein